MNSFLRRTAWLLILILALSAGRAAAQEKASGKYPLLLLIRHAEKTGDKKDNQLSDAGKERAKQLPVLFAKSQKRAETIPVPDFIIAAHDSKNSQRPRLTVTPLSLKLKLTIDDRFHSSLPKDDAKAKGAAELRDELFKEPKYAGKVVLISWRHSKLPELARTLKADNAPTKWADEVYDRVWRISYDATGKAMFSDVPMRLMAGDAQK